MLATPEAVFPRLSDAIESWHALAVPVAHHGAVNWRGTIEENSALRVTQDDRAGTLAVVTTAGYTERAPDDIPRIKLFIQGIAEVMRFYSGLDGNLRNDVFNGGHDLRDGFTFTLWRDDQAMMQAAYRAGTHRTQMDRHREKPMFDRSSFSRLRILSASGSWDGADPLAA